jgi:hypothetical protein
MHNLAMFDWNDLRHFRAVARHGSTLAAAKALGVSRQSTAACANWNAALVADWSSAIRPDTD